MARLIYCPFLIADLLDKKGENKISCENGRLIFYNRETVKEYMDKYCACPDGWKKCTLASSLMQYYEREDI